VGTREVTLAAKSLRVLLLALSVLAATTNRGRGKLTGSRGVGILQWRLVVRGRLGISVLGESTALANGLGGERIGRDGARRLLDGLLRGKRVGGDLGAAGAVRERSALEIHIEEM